MNNHPTFSARTLILALLLCPALTLGQDLKPLILPAPQTDGGKPLMQVLKDRHTTREFSPDKLPPQVLANLLWAADGINRPDTGKRTAPSANNWQEVDIYVTMADGVYVYDPKGNKLDPILAEDLRGATGAQPFVKDAPVTLVYVADLTKIKKDSPEDKNFYSAADTAFIAQNVYLFCASEGLSVVVRAGIDRVSLAKAMKLRPDQKVVLAQTLGYPKK